MATWRSLIERSYKDLGVLASGESASAAQLADATESLEELLAQWGMQALATPGTARWEFAPASKSSTISIAPSGADVAAPAPPRIRAAYYRPDGQTPYRPLRHSSERLVGIADPAAFRYPSLWTYELGKSAGTLRFDACFGWTPAAGEGFVLVASARLADSPVSLDSAMGLPDEYVGPLRQALAVRMAQANSRDLSPLYLREAREGANALRRMNLPVSESSPNPLLPSRRSFGGGLAPSRP